jgi:hypothetical protein
LTTCLSKGRSSLVRTSLDEHTGDVSMYVTLLSGALDLFDTDLDDDALLDHVRQCRAALPAHNLGAGVCQRRRWSPRSPTTARSSAWPPTGHRRHPDQLRAPEDRARPPRARVGRRGALISKLRSHQPSDSEDA